MVKNAGLLVLYMICIASTAGMVLFTYGGCAWEHRNFKESFYTILRLSFSEIDRPETSLYKKCNSDMAKFYYVIIVVLIKIVFSTILISRMIGVIEIVRESEKQRIE